MYFDNLQALLFMEGHGIYVWPAYALAAVVIAVVLIAPLRRRKRLLAQLAAELRQTQAAARVSKG